MPLYTRTGDLGETALNGGPRVGKDHYRIEALGTIDELTSALGLARAFVDNPDDSRIEILNRLILESFILSEELASPYPKHTGVRCVTDELIQGLERDIDRFPFSATKFVEPPRDKFRALLFSARAIARTAERRAVSVVRNAPAGELVNPLIMTYLNRLSDLLFVMSESECRRSTGVSPA